MENCETCGNVKLQIDGNICKCNEYFWRKIETHLPNIGQEVILFSEGAVYDKTFHLKRYNNFLYWCRKNKKRMNIKKGDEWVPLPRSSYYMNNEG